AASQEGEATVSPRAPSWRSWRGELPVEAAPLAGVYVPRVRSPRGSIPQDPRTFNALASTNALG
ncbi:MAG TPA: hypothetical protein VIY86_10615, partial [Pirellulaceae bacterium]